MEKQTLVKSRNVTQEILNVTQMKIFKTWFVKIRPKTLKFYLEAIFIYSDSKSTVQQERATLCEIIDL